MTDYIKEYALTVAAAALAFISTGAVIVLLVASMFKFTIFIWDIFNLPLPV